MFYTAFVNKDTVVVEEELNKIMSHTRRHTALRRTASLQSGAAPRPLFFPALVE